MQAKTVSTGQDRRRARWTLPAHAGWRCRRKRAGQASELPGKGHGPRVRQESEARQAFAGGGAEGVTVRAHARTGMEWNPREETTDPALPQAVLG